MIRVTIEIIPHGTLPAEKIASIEIVNDLSHPDRPAFGNYCAEIEINGGTQDVRVKNHMRRDGIIPLLAHVCDAWRKIPKDEQDTITYHSRGERGA